MNDSFWQDISKFVALWGTGIWAYRRHRPQVDVAIDTVLIEGELAARAAERLAVHNTVAVIRPIFSFQLLLQFLALLIPSLVYLWLGYLWMPAIHVLASLGLIAYPAWRRWRHVGVRAFGFRDLDRLYDRDITSGFGPSDRLQKRDFVLNPLMLVLHGAATLLIALITKHAYGTSAYFIAPVAFSGFFMIVIGLFIFGVFLAVAKRLVGGVGTWMESVLGAVTERILDVGLFGFDMSNVRALMPGSFTDELVDFIGKAEKDYQAFNIPVKALGLFAAMSLSLAWTSFAAILLVSYGFWNGIRISHGSPALAKQATRRAEFAIPLFEGFSLLLFFVVVFQTLMFKLHAVPSYSDGPLESLAAAWTWIVHRQLLAIILSWPIYKIYKSLEKPATDEPLTLRVVFRRVAFVAFVALGLSSMGFWTGENITANELHLKRFIHTQDEQRYCLNGMLDGDEVFTDHGPHCNPYRRIVLAPEQPFNGPPVYQHGDGWLYSPPNFISTEPVAHRSWPVRKACKWFGIGCPESARATANTSSTTSQTSTPGYSPGGGRHDGTQMASNDDPSKAFHRPSSGTVSLSRPVSEFDPMIEEAAQATGLAANLIRAVIKVESNFNPWAVSRTGCQGLMQLCPSAARRVNVTDRFDPGQSIRGGSEYLRIMLDHRGGNLTQALAAYNAGLGNMSAGMSYAQRVLYYYHGYESGIGIEEMPRYAGTAPLLRDVTPSPPVRIAFSQETRDTCSVLSGAFLQRMQSLGSCP